MGCIVDKWYDMVREERPYKSPQLTKEQELKAMRLRFDIYQQEDFLRYVCMENMACPIQMALMWLSRNLDPSQMVEVTGLQVEDGEPTYEEIRWKLS